MITLIHNNKTVVKVFGPDAAIRKVHGATVAKTLVEIGSAFPEEKIVWCHETAADQINYEFIGSHFSAIPVIVSYNPSSEEYLGRKIGYIEPSLFIRVNKEVRYPTWQLSAAVGFIQGSLLKGYADQLETDADFNYFLQSLGKRLIPQGVLCYSDPCLLTSPITIPHKKAGDYRLFRFVKQHFEIKWIFMLLFDLALYEKRFPLLPFLFSIFYRKRKLKYTNDANSGNEKRSFSEATIDVIIPTIGRPQYLYDVLTDLTKQSLLPKKVIIVEQNPDSGSASELEYISAESWPFEIKHFFTHQSGACNARNIALAEISNEWVFLADDDIRMDAGFLQDCLHNVTDFKQQAITVACLRQNDKPYIHNVKQWGTFGSGCSFVSADAIRNLRFDTRFEFGFGEDADFGMQLRNTGVDVLYFPSPLLLHLKAPMGGFRTKPVLAWQHEAIQPKPSPTIMLYKLKYHTKEQLNGYKTSMFFKHFKHQSEKNPYQYIQKMRKQWDVSMYWATKLKNS